MSLSDIEHCSSMLAGCESLLNGDTKTPDAVYAFTVLKLHASDAGFLAGQEGFVDSIKQGAKSFKEWIKKLITSIISFVTGKNKTIKELERDAAKKEKEYDQWLAKEKKKEKANDDKYLEQTFRLMKDGPKFIPMLESLIKKVKEQESKTVSEFEDLAIPHTPSLENTIKKLESAIKIAEDGDLTDLLKAIRHASGVSLDDVKKMTDVLKYFSDNEIDT